MLYQVVGALVKFPAVNRACCVGQMTAVELSCVLEDVFSQMCTQCVYTVVLNERVSNDTLALGSVLVLRLSTQ